MLCSCGVIAWGKRLDLSGTVISTLGEKCDP
jgi:hypothetical protein